MSVVPLPAQVPRDLRLLPFRGSTAVRAGLVTWAQLRRSGWQRLLPDVYIAADVELDYRLRCLAALVYARGTRCVEGVAVSGLSAAACWGVNLAAPNTPVELTVPPTLRLDSRPRQVKLVRSLLTPADMTTLGTITLTVPERTAFDVVRRSARVDGIVGLDALLDRRATTVSTLIAYAQMMAGRPGSRTFADALRFVEPLSESPMETRSRLVLTDGGLPRPVAQHVVRDMAGGFVARLDLAYPIHRVGMEYEGDHHRSRETFRRDIARLNALTALDWIIVRVTADDIYRYPDKLVRRMRDLLARRAAGFE